MDDSGTPTTPSLDSATPLGTFDATVDGAGGGVGATGAGSAIVRKVKFRAEASSRPSLIDLRRARERTRTKSAAGSAWDHFLLTASACGLFQVKKVVDMRLDAPELAVALKELSEFYGPNTLENRRNLRSSIERRGVEVRSDLGPFVLRNAS